MKSFVLAGKTVFFDLASTLAFLALYLATKSIPLSVAAGILSAFGQVAWEIRNGKPIGALQWLSLAIVIASGLATLFTQNFEFIMLKPTVFYIVAGVVMLKPGWMNRYLPAIAIQTVPDLGIMFGYVWAALMFISAAVNVIVAMRFGLVTWASFMSVYAIATKLTLFVIQYTTMRAISGRRRMNSRPLQA